MVNILMRGMETDGATFDHSLSLHHPQFEQELKNQPRPACEDACAHV